MTRSKIESYLGFARRAGKLTLGVRAAEYLKRVDLLIADESVAKNNRKEIEKLSEKFGCRLLYVPSLEELVKKPNAKLAAVSDKNLAEAIIKAQSEEAPKAE